MAARNKRQPKANLNLVISYSLYEISLSSSSIKHYSRFSLTLDSSKTNALLPHHPSTVILVFLSFYFLLVYHPNTFDYS
ncbi:hypothetical protein L9F63_000804, partial [Diploptera punctata]